MEEQTDKVVIRNISLVFLGLVLFGFSIFFLAKIVGHKDPQEVTSRAALTEARIAPVSAVYAGEDGAAAIEASAAATATSSTQTVAFDGSLDGEMIYNNVCSACHAAAVLGAPQPGSAEIAARAGAGMDAMIQNALNGINAMPARGGRPDLSDEQIKATIEYMLK